MKTTFRPTIRLLIMSIIAGCVWSGQARADEVYGRVRGTATDATGAALPSLVVRATNTATGLVFEATTDASGAYEFLQLPIGPYKITATRNGFKAYEASGITLTVGQIYVQNLRLQLGEVSERVTVQADAAQVELTSMQRGDTIESRQIVDLPLNGRNWLQLHSLAPGVVASSDRFGTFSTNGNETQQNSYLINGADNNDVLLNNAWFSPNPDAMAEFQLVTSTINPEYGRNSGAILNATIKSGTNEFHGDVFEFYRDTALNARNFFELKPAVFHQNQFGGTIGGPIWRDHTFFFFSYQGTRIRQTQQFTTPLVPTSAERNGIFGAAGAAEFSSSTGVAPIQEFGDSASPCPVGGAPCPAFTPFATLFSTGNIPSQDFNDLSAKLMQQFIPLPNLGTNKFTFTPLDITSDNQELFRIDHTFNSHDSIWWYSFFAHEPETQDLPFAVFAALPGFGQLNRFDTMQHTATWNHLFSAATLNEFRITVNRFNVKFANPKNPRTPDSFGFTGINPQFPGLASLPDIFIGGGGDSEFSMGFTTQGPQPRVDNLYQLTDNFSKAVGRHSLKFGYSGRRFEVHLPFASRNSGTFGFTGNGPIGSGNAFADFLLGFPSNGYAQNTGRDFESRAYEHYSYAQDQYKVLSNLTLTYGVGWDIETPMTDNNGISVDCFRPGQQSKVFPTAPAGLVFPGDPGCPKAGYSTRYTDFGPRVGFAWSPRSNSKLSVRGGYGIYYNRTEQQQNIQNVLGVPFTLASGGIADIGGGASFTAPFTDVRCIDQHGNPVTPPVPITCSIPNKFPFSTPAVGSNVDFSVYEPFSINVIDPHFRSPSAQNYNLTIEKELPSRMIFSIGYVGSLGRHLETTFELNPAINPKGCAATPACADNPGLQYFNFPQNFKYNSRIFGSLGQEATVGTSSYNSLQVDLKKHFSRGLTFEAAYTWSHALDISSNFEDRTLNPQANNPFDLKRFRGDSQYDARERFVFNYQYDIPSLPQGPTLLTRDILGGWRLGGIVTLQTGFPITINDNPGFIDFTSLTCNGFIIFYSCWQTPDITGPVKILNPRNNPNHLYFDTSVFTNPALGTFGNAGRNFFHGPGIANWDFDLAKDIPIKEQRRIELRVELFNILNHTQFLNPPDGTFGDAAFGQVTNARPPRIVQLAAKFYF